MAIGLSFRIENKYSYLESWLVPSESKPNTYFIYRENNHEFRVIIDGLKIVTEVLLRNYEKEHLNSLAKQKRELKRVS